MRSAEFVSIRCSAAQVGDETVPANRERKPKPSARGQDCAPVPKCNYSLRFINSNCRVQSGQLSR